MSTIVAEARKLFHKDAAMTLVDGVPIFVEEAHAVPLVAIVIGLRTGTSEDPDGKEGLSRVAFRMLRRGCAGLSATEIERAVDTLGGEFSVDTGVSSIAVHAQVIARNLEPFVALLSKIISAPTFPDDEFERLKRETVAELIEARDSDRSLAQQAFRRGMFAGHPYGRAASGTIESVERLTASEARALYARHFVRRNIVIGFAGDITRERAEDVTKKLVASIADGEGSASVLEEPSIPPGRRLIFVDKPERTQTQILIGTLGTWPHDEDHFDLTVANAIFGGTFTSRLMREVRSKRGWSYGTSARLGVDRRRHAFSMWTFPAATDAAACLALELEMLETLVAKGVTPKEVSFIKRYLTRSHAFEIDTAPKRLHQALDVALLGLPEDYYSGYLKRIAGVTPESATRAVQARIHPDDLLVVVVGTASVIFDSVRDAIPRLESHSIVPFDTLS